MEIDVTDDELMKLSKEELIERIKYEQKQNRELQNVIDGLKNNSNQDKKDRFEHHGKKFDFKRYQKRHIMLKFLYLGWNYNGYTCQETLDDTIEKLLFDALIKTKLIENRESSNYHRCGRTDKGVSAFCQVISITVRSNKKCDSNTDLSNADDELDYPSILNRVLPTDIRMISWAPLHDSMISARFDCCRRVYHYYFPRIDLDINAMNEACAILVGVHDFRNLCRMDVANGVTNYIRHVFSASIGPFDDNKGADDVTNPYSIYVFRIEASAFLWHQIRYIMAVLFLIGQHLESPNIFTELFDIEKHPSRPQFSMASDLPLVLYEAHYDEEKVPYWLISKDIINTVSQLRSQWMHKSIQATIIQSMTDSLMNSYSIKSNETFNDMKKLYGNPVRNHKKLFDRPCCHSLQMQLDKHQQKRLKIE